MLDLVNKIVKSTRKLFWLTTQDAPIWVSTTG